MSNESIEDIFNQADTAEVESRSTRIKRMIDLNVVAPAKVAANDWRAVIGSLLMLGFILMGTVGAAVVKKPTSGEAPVLAPPFQDWHYFLGTDVYGQPIGAQLIHSTPPILKMILAGAIVSVGFAAVIGLVSGFMRDTIVDTVLMTDYRRRDRHSRSPADHRPRGDLSAEGPLRRRYPPRDRQLARPRPDDPIAGPQHSRGVLRRRRPNHGTTAHDDSPS